MREKIKDWLCFAVAFAIAVVIVALFAVVIKLIGVILSG